MRPPKGKPTAAEITQLDAFLAKKGMTVKDQRKAFRAPGKSQAQIKTKLRGMTREQIKDNVVEWCKGLPKA